jgi:hypothetical protein
MKVIKPTAFVEASHLVSSSATESVAAWSSATSYASGATVRTGGRLYQSLVASNLNNNPPSTPLAWADIGPDNTHAMFDGQISTATTATGSLVVTLSPGVCNSVALLGLVGSSARIKLLDAPSGNTVYDKTVTLEGSIVTDWYQYFYETFVQLDQVVLTDLPPYGSSRLTVTLTGGGAVQIGQLLFGAVYQLGDMQYGASAGITDYSRKDTDDFGKTTFVRRAYSKRLTGRLMLDLIQLNKVQRVLSDLRATPAVWIGVEDGAYLPLTVYGYYKDFSIEVSYPTTSYCSLEIEGLT